MAASNDTDIKPDHVIIWLDKNMGVKEHYRTDKKDLASTANPDCLPSNECSHDIDNLICRVDSTMNGEQWNDLITNPLQMFVDETKCIKCINDSIKAKKKVFLITSGTMGKLIVPEIYNQLSGFIYIFCAHMAAHEEWTQPYLNGIEIRDDEKGVFGKVLSDIAIYYYQKIEETSSDRTSSIKYLEWARRLFLRASKLDKCNREEFLKLIGEALAKLGVSQSNQNDDNDGKGQIADDG